MVKRRKGLISTLFDLQEIEDLTARESAQEFLKRKKKEKARAKRRRVLIFKLREFGLTR